MARKAIIPLIICLLALKCPVSVTPVSMPSEAQAPSSCRVSITNLITCVGYLTGKAIKPSNECCSSLASISQITDAAACLCTLVANDRRLDVYMNRRRVLDMPAQCNISVPHVRECQGLGFVPVAAPVRKSNVTGSNLSNGASDCFVSLSIQFLVGLTVLNMGWILGFWDGFW